MYDKPMPDTNNASPKTKQEGETIPAEPTTSSSSEENKKSNESASTSPNEPQKSNTDTNSIDQAEATNDAGPQQDKNEDNKVEAEPTTQAAAENGVSDNATDENTKTDEKPKKRFGFFGKKARAAKEQAVPEPVQQMVLEMTQTKQLADMIEKELYESNDYWVVRMKKRTLIVWLGLLLLGLWLLPMVRWLMTR